MAQDREGGKDAGTEPAKRPAAIATLTKAKTSLLLPKDIAETAESAVSSECDALVALRLRNGRHVANVMRKALFEVLDESEVETELRGVDLPDAQIQVLLRGIQHLNAWPPQTRQLCVETTLACLSTGLERAAKVIDTPTVSTLVTEDVEDAESEAAQRPAAVATLAEVDTSISHSGEAEGHSPSKEILDSQSPLEDEVHLHASQHDTQRPASPLLHEEIAETLECPHAPHTKSTMASLL